MANNFQAKDGNGTLLTFKSTDNASVHTPHHNVDSLPADPLGANADAAATTGATGSISAKLRGISRDIGSTADAPSGTTGTLIAQLRYLKDLVFNSYDAINLAFRAVVSTVPTDPFGNNADAAVAAGATGSYSAKLRRITQGLEDLKTLIVLAAGENHVGQVSGHSDVVSVTPTVSASPDYSIGDAVGGKQTITSAMRVSGGKSLLQSIFLVDKANVKPQFTILFFDSDPSAATITDNSAFVFSTDIAKCIGKIKVTTGDWDTYNSIAIADIAVPGRVKKASGSANLYAAVVADAAINLASTTDLRFDYGFLQD